MTAANNRRGVIAMSVGMAEEVNIDTKDKIKTKLGQYKTLQ